MPYYHYTNHHGAMTISSSGYLQPSEETGAFGPGVYLTDLHPREFFRNEILENNYGGIQERFQNRADWVVEVLEKNIRMQLLRKVHVPGEDDRRIYVYPHFIAVDPEQIYDKPMCSKGYAADEEVEEFEEDTDEFDEEIDQLDEEIDEFGGKVDEYGEEVDQFNEGTDQFDEEVDELGGEVDEYGEEVDQFDEETDQFDEETDQFDEEVDEFSEEVDEYGEQNDEFGENEEMDECVIDENGFCAGGDEESECFECESNENDEAGYDSENGSEDIYYEVWNDGNCNDECSDDSY